MQFDRDICYRAVQSRDARFDGRFFTGVRSTGIYCRPICPARTPAPRNCVFFGCAAAAEDAGFRPCRRCRPETSPGTPAWQGSSATISRALRLIEEGALDTGDLPGLAARLGMGDRHLRRLFVEHLGASPRAVAMTRRIHFAKRLLESTSLPIGQIALEVGFNNVRRFNVAFLSRTDVRPGEVRRALAGRTRTSDPTALELGLSYRPPLAWGAMMRYLAARAIPGIERVDKGSYRRALQIPGQQGGGFLSLSHDQKRREIRVCLPGGAARHLEELIRRVRDLLDLDADPIVIADHLSQSPGMVRLRTPRGLRVPGAFDRFELGVRAILGQQVTVTRGSQLTGRLVEQFGTPLAIIWPSGEEAYGFPRPSRLARLTAARLASIGLPLSRAKAIRALAVAVAGGRPVLETAASQEEAVSRLMALDGIGDWTAQYIAMRALREPDAFPAGDLGLRRALAAGGRDPSAARVREMADGWRPWRAYAAMGLWYRLAQDAGG